MSEDVEHDGTYRYGNRRFANKADLSEIAGEGVFEAGDLPDDRQL